jgi:hypothetical protein
MNIEKNPIHHIHVKISLTVPERISCGQQFNRNGRQTRRSSNDILDLAEPVICFSDKNKNFIFGNLVIKKKK